ncbi:MAG: hypothetical protein J5767_12370 [Paludibacteraceae bacterium]|nr:hypothetical protein [Paludibacteraceae bacterium]
MMTIADTFFLMVSDDPKKKLLAEYYQTAIRYHDVLNAPDNFPQKKKLLGVMAEYLDILYKRCQDLNIKPIDSMDLNNIVRFIASDKSDSKGDSCKITLYSKFDRMIQLLESIDSKLNPVFGHDLRIFDLYQKQYIEPLYSPYKVTCGTTDGFKVTTTNGYKVTFDTTEGIKYTCSPAKEEDFRQKE